MKHIKLLHIISNTDVAGAQILLYDLLQYLQTHGFDQEVITFKKGPYTQKIEKLDIPVHIIKGYMTRYDPIFFYRFFKLLRTYNPDCIHSVLWAANFLARIAAWLFSFPLVQSLHNNLEHNGIVRCLLDRISAFKTGPIVAVSHGIARSVDLYTPWLKQHELVVIKNGIELEKVKKNIKEHSITRNELGFTSEHFIIGSVGRFEPVKNYQLLLTACALLYDDYPQVRLVLVGYGSQERFLRARAQTLGIQDRVTFIINQPGYKYYKLFDCFALSSLTEGISIALLEAMAAGCPIVTTSSSYDHDVINHNKNGQIVPPQDAQALSQAFTCYIKDSLFAQKCSQDALKTVEESFNTTSMHKKYDYLCKELAALKKKSLYKS